jgi:DNA primase
VSQGRIPEDVINQIRDRADIETVVSGYMALSRSGQNLKGLCPFHAEKTPSFSVSPSKQMFYCFGCGVGGNVFTFLMKLEGLAFQEAARELARRVGVSIPVAPERPGSPDAAARKRLEQMNELAAAWYQENLGDPEGGKAARGYLAGRGIQPATAEAFGLGLALPAWEGLLQRLAREGYAAKEAALAGLAVARDQGGQRASGAAGYYDRFRDRIMFPIRDLQKRVIAFGGRVLGEETPKYLNSSDTPLFQKGRTLYGMERARDAASSSKTLIIVEGYFDAIALHQAGITNVAATLGTALTGDHIQTIRRFASRVVLLFDPDPAGVRAALRTLDLFVDSGIGVRVVSLPGGDDPDTFVRKQGCEAFRRLEETAPSLLDFAVEQSLRSAGSGAIEDRIRSVDEILRVLQKAGNRIEKEECTKRVAERLGISQQRLIERYPELLAPRPRRPSAPASAPPAPSAAKRPPEERDLAHLLIQGLLTPGTLLALQPEAFSVPGYRRLVELGLHHRGGDGRVLIRSLLDEATADPVCGPVALELSMTERHYDDAQAHAEGCLVMLTRKRYDDRLSELKAQLHAAGRDGRQEEARQVNAEIKELTRKKAGGASSPAA